MKTKLVQKISDYLIINRKGREVGLMEGNMGICLFLYYSYRTTSNTLYRKYADSLLDDIYKRLNPSSVTFDFGLAGVGWGIEYFVNHNFCKGNTDQILEEVDSHIFKYIQEQPKLTLNLTNGLAGYLLYIVSRLRNKSKFGLKESAAINQLLFRQIIDKIDVETSNAFQYLNKDIHANSFNAFPWIIYALREALTLNLYNEKISYILQQWLFNFEVNIPRLHIHRLSLAIALRLVDDSLEKKQFDRLINNILYSIDYEVLYKELNPYSFNLSDGWHGFVYLLKKASEVFNKEAPGYEMFDSTRCRIIKVHEEIFEDYIDQLSNPPRGLLLPLLDIKNGLAGVGLLYMIYPDAFV